MPKRNVAQQWAIERALSVIEKVAYPALCECQSDIEDCGCKNLWKKLDTINGKLENLMRDLHNATKQGGEKNDTVFTGWS